MLNEELVILNKIQKYLKESYQNIGDAMISGGIDNMEKYKYMMGQAPGISATRQHSQHPLNQRNIILGLSGVTAHAQG